MNLELSGKVALVTAASKGIGAGIALSLVREGCRVIISSSDAGNLAAAKRTIQEHTGVAVDTAVIDMRRPEDVAAKARALAGSHGPIHIAIANGPGPKPMGVEEVSAEVLLGAVETNLLSTVALCHALLPGMKKSKFGRIIALTSSTATEPDEGMALSSTARAGVVAYIKTLSREVARSGITANSVLTGSVLTDRSRALLAAEAAASNMDADAMLEQASASIPAGYIATPEQFSYPIVFLCSPLAAYVNGISLPIDGGYMRGL